MSDQPTRRPVRPLLGLLSLLLLTIAPALHAQTPVMTTAVVPVVGTIDGMNGYRWKTEVQLHNPLATEATVAMSLPTAPEEPAIITTVPPLQSVNFPDVVAAFGIETALSPLVVQTEGRRSVWITATVIGIRGSEVTQPQPIAVEYGRTYFPQRMLSGLSFSDQFRTNVGLVNLGEKTATFTIALQRVAGRNLAITRVALPPNSISHASIQSLFPLITNGNDFAIVAETSSASTYVYASVIENETNMARFVQPILGAVPIESAAGDH